MPQCRDIYYRDPQLFGKQALVDRYVDDIAFTFNVTRRDLNVVSELSGRLIDMTRAWLEIDNHCRLRAQRVSMLDYLCLL